MLCPCNAPALRAGVQKPHVGRLSAGQGALPSGALRIVRVSKAGAPRTVGTAASATSTQVVGEVSVQLDNVSFSSRKLLASVSIAAPLDVVWGALTDYERLDTFIPSLAQNRCLQRRPQGALLYQVGAQEVALGVKFCAATTLECIEHIDGVSTALCTCGLEGLGALFPWPSNGLPGRAARDITFQQLKGDFSVFKGIWRMQQGLQGGDSTHLAYALYVQPQPWLPVGLIQNRITKEVINNLQAVRKHAERLYTQGYTRTLEGA